MVRKEKPYDVVIIGSGGAGLRAAISALDTGASTLVIAKGKINRSGATLLAGANISADIACDGESLSRMGIEGVDAGDTKEKWFEDTIHEGFYLNNQDLVEVFVEQAADRVQELMDWGMKVRGTEGERGISVFGSDILDSLFTACRDRHLDYLEDTMFTDIVVEDNTVKGVLCLDIPTGELKFIPARAVVMATGGAHNLFSMNSGSTDLQGEGPGAALKAGADLVDMEFISFCPTVMLRPAAYKGNILPYIFQTLGYSTLKNRTGNAFTGRYLSKELEELALYTEWNKMLLSYVIQREIEAGGGASGGGIYQQMNYGFKQVREEMYTDLPSLSKGIYADLMKIPEGKKAFVVSPAAHYFEGGIRIDRRMATSVQGLFAAGECTGGLFGANRVSAATTEMIVEGAVAGTSAGRYAKDSDFSAAADSLVSEYAAACNRPFSAGGGVSVETLVDETRRLADTGLWILRDRESLSAAFEDFRGLIDRVESEVSFENRDRAYNLEFVSYLQLRNSLYTAAAIAAAAEARKESRGVHVRRDFDQTDNTTYLKNCKISGTGFNVSWEPVTGKKHLPEWDRMDYLAVVEDVEKKLS